MKTKLSLTLVFVLVLAIGISTASTTSLADISVGVKQGDWIEYNIAFTGNPPVEHDVVWARMEIVSVEGKGVDARFISRLANGTMIDVLEDLDFETGRLIDLFIIPAGLNVGDTFNDQAVGEVEIDGVEVRSCAAADRTVVRADAVETRWYWDRAMGVVVEARTSNSMYTLDTVAYSTSMWSPQILGLDSTVFYAMVIVAVGAIVAVSVLLIRRKRRPDALGFNCVSPETEIALGKRLFLSGWTVTFSY
jgi:hypothetical protein